MIKVHPLIVDKMGQEYADKMVKLAKKLKLTKIDSGSRYKVSKGKAKKGRPANMADSFSTVGYPYLIGNETEVALYFNGIHDWFKTSAIVKTTFLKTKIKVETLNSIYYLEKV